jgi:hypothetical protein
MEHREVRRGHLAAVAASPSAAWGLMLFVLLAAAPAASAQEFYFIKAKHSGKCLHQHGGTYGDGDRITQWDCVDEPNVKVQKVPAGDDTFFLKFWHSGKCVHLHGGYPANGTPITQWQCLNLPNVKWREQDAGDGYVYLRSVATDKCIHQHVGTQGNGDPITQWDCVDEPNVQWMLVPTDVDTTANRNPRVTLKVHSTSCRAPCWVFASATAWDPDADPLTYTWSGCTQFGAGTGAFCYVPGVGSWLAVVTVSDGRGGSAGAMQSVWGTAH